MKNENKIVLYKFGNNKEFEYTIIDSKENAIEKEFSKDSLVFKFCGSTKSKISTYGELPFGNYDLVLEKRTKKTNSFCGLLLVHEDDVTEIL